MSGGQNACRVDTIIGKTVIKQKDLHPKGLPDFRTSGLPDRGNAKGGNENNPPNRRNRFVLLRLVHA